MKSRMTVRKISHYMQTLLHKQLAIIHLANCSNISRVVFFLVLISATGCANIEPTEREHLQTSADNAFTAGQYQLAFDEYLKLAETGDKLAQYRVSLMYSDGLGVATSLSKAFAWASVAGEFGTEFLVNHWHELNDLIHPNDKQRIYELAADYFRRFNSTALSSEVASLRTRGTTQMQYANTLYQHERYRDAIVHYQQLAATGEKFSQYRLSQMYAHGLGTDSDLPRAYAWAALAADLKSPLMLAQLEQINQRMNDELLLDAQNHVSSIANASIVNLARQRMQRLRNIRYRCKGPRSTCDDYIQAVCGGNPECSSEYGFDILRARPGTSIEDEYNLQASVMQGIVDDFEQTAEQVILGEFRVLEDEADKQENPEQKEPQ